KFDRGGVEVDAIDTVQCDIRFGLLQFLLEHCRIDPFADLLLFAPQILSCELVDGFEREGAGSQGRLAHREVKDGIGRHILGEQFCQCLGDGETGEHFRGVIRSRLLPVTAGQPEDKAPPAVDAWLLFSRHLIRLDRKGTRLNSTRVTVTAPFRARARSPTVRSGIASADISSVSSSARAWETVKRVSTSGVYYEADCCRSRPDSLKTKLPLRWTRGFSSPVPSSA